MNCYDDEDSCEILDKGTFDEQFVMDFYKSRFTFVFF